jgi:hypothetical protein
MPFRDFCHNISLFLVAAIFADCKNVSSTMARTEKLQPRRWGVPQTKQLYANIQSGDWDPERTAAAYLNDIYDNLGEESLFCAVSQENFRKHYREKSVQYMTELSMTGVRRSEFVKCVLA